MTSYPVWDLLLPSGQHGSPRRRVLGASGHRLTFAEDGDVLDATSGLWNVNLGYGNPAITAAICQALTDASYLTLFRYTHDHARDAATALIAAAGGDSYRQVLFSTSGGAANDTAMKLARQYHVLCGEPRRRLVVGLRGGFHGQTYGSLALSGQDLGQEMYGVDSSLVRHAHHADPAELTALLAGIGAQVAAVVVEPVLGSGARAVPDQMIAALLGLRREHGFLLVCDEVATGFGRTGPLFASQLWAEAPDVLLTSKGLTNGTCAAAALLVGHPVCAAFDRAGAVFGHGETQAGTPASCAAMVATLDQFTQLRALATGRRNAELLATGLAAIAKGNQVVSEVTGAGCFLGLHLRRPNGGRLWPHQVDQVIDAVRRRGALVHPGPSAVQVVPALTYTEPEIDELLAAVEAGLADFATRPRGQRKPAR